MLKLTLPIGAIVRINDNSPDYELRHEGDGVFIARNLPSFIEGSVCENQHRSEWPDTIGVEEISADERPRVRRISMIKRVVPESPSP